MCPDRSCLTRSPPARPVPAAPEAVQGPAWAWVGAGALPALSSLRPLCHHYRGARPALPAPRFVLQLLPLLGARHLLVA